MGRLGWTVRGSPRLAFEPSLLDLPPQPSGPTCALFQDTSSLPDESRCGHFILGESAMMQRLFLVGVVEEEAPSPRERIKGLRVESLPGPRVLHN